MTPENAVDVCLREPQVNIQPGHPDRIPVTSQAYPALTIGDLLTMILKRITILGTIGGKEARNFTPTGEKAPGAEANGEPSDRWAVSYHIYKMCAY